MRLRAGPGALLVEYLASVEAVEPERRVERMRLVPLAMVQAWHQPAPASP